MKNWGDAVLFVCERCGANYFSGEINLALSELALINNTSLTGGLRRTVRPTSVQHIKKRMRLAATSRRHYSSFPFSHAP